MRWTLLALLLAALPVSVGAETSTTTEEVEVTFTEEIDRSELDDLPPLPEYDYSSWLLALPVICAAVVAWNVRWKSGPRRHQRRRRG